MSEDKKTEVERQVLDWFCTYAHDRGDQPTGYWIEFGPDDAPEIQALVALIAAVREEALKQARLEMAVYSGLAEKLCEAEDRAAEYKAERDAFKVAAEMQAQNATHNRFLMLRQIIEACPKAGVVSGLELGVKVICDEYDALKAEKADVEASSEMFANRLRETATALGKPISGTNSSWHDIPEQVSALKAKNEKNFEALRLIADLEGEKDEDGMIAPREPLSWKSCAMAAVDYARDALEEKPNE